MAFEDDNSIGPLTYFATFDAQSASGKSSPLTRTTVRTSLNPFSATSKDVKYLFLPEKLVFSIFLRLLFDKILGFIDPFPPTTIPFVIPVL